MAEPPCLLDVISDPDALNLFLNDPEDDQAVDKPSQQPDTSVGTQPTPFPDSAKAVTNGNPPTPSQGLAGSSPFPSVQGVGQVAPPAAAFLHQQAARSNTQHGVSCASSPRGMQQPPTPGSVAGSPYNRHISSVPSPASVQAKTPSPMPSPATTPNLHQPIKIINSNSLTQQPQLIIQGQQQLPQNVQISVPNQPNVQVQPQITAMPTSAPSIQLVGQNGPQGGPGGTGQVQQALQIPGTVIQTSLGNKIILQGQPNLLANSNQQINIGSLSGLQQVQLQSQAVSVKSQQQQLVRTGNVQALATSTSTNNQPPSLQAPPNINIMNLQAQPRPQQVLIQQNVGGSQKQNVLLTTLGNGNVVRLAGGAQQGAVQTGMMVNQGQQSVILANGSQGPVLLQQQPSGIQGQASQIQIAGIKPGSQSTAPVAQLNAQGQIVNIQQNPPQPAVIQNTVIGSSPANVANAQQQKPSGTHIININGQAVALSSQQLQQLLALQRQKQGQPVVQGVQVLANSSLAQTVTSTTTGKSSEPGAHQAEATHAAVQQHLQEIHEKLALQKRQQAPQPQKGPSTAISGIQQIVTASSQMMNANQVGMKPPVAAQAGGATSINQLGGVTLVAAPGQPQQQSKQLNIVGAPVQAVIQQNTPAGLVQFQKPAVQTNSSVNPNLVTLQAVVQQGSNTKQPVSQFRQILPSTSQVTSSANSSMSNATSAAAFSTPSASPALSKPGAAPNVNVQKMGIGNAHLSQPAQDSNPTQSLTSLPGSVAHLLPGLSATSLSQLVTSSSIQLPSLSSRSTFSTATETAISSFTLTTSKQGSTSTLPSHVNNTLVSVPNRTHSVQLLQNPSPQVRLSVGQQQLQMGNVAPQQAGLQQQTVMAQQQVGFQVVGSTQNTIVKPQITLGQQSMPMSTQLQARQLVPSQLNASQQGTTPQQIRQPPPPGPQPQLNAAQQISLPQPSPQLQGVQGVSAQQVASQQLNAPQPAGVQQQAVSVPPVSGQALVTQQITVQQPGQPGTNPKVATIQLTPQIQQALTNVQHKIKILLAVQNRTEAQNDTLKQLADCQQKLVAFGRNQALKVQQQQQLQQQQQQQQGVPQPALLVDGQSAMLNARTNLAQQPTPIMATSASVSSVHVTQQTVPVTALPVQVQPLVTTAGTNTGVTTTFATSTVVTSAPTGLPDPKPDPNVSSTQETKVITDINQLPPHMKEKLRQQLAKLTPSQLDYFLKNQASILAKLVKQHQEMAAQQKQKQDQLGNIQQTVPTQPTTGQTRIICGSSATVLPVSGTNSNGNGTPATVTNKPNQDTKPAVTVMKSVPPKMNRKQVLQHYITKDQKIVEEPDWNKPFQNRKDILKRLLAYHICQVKQDKKIDIREGEMAYESAAQELMEKKSTMFKKYQHLILEESMKEERTAEMVMLERMFLASEKEILAAERKQAAEDPGNFVPTPIISSSDEEDDEDDHSGVSYNMTDNSLTSPTSNLLSPVLKEFDGPRKTADSKHSINSSMDNPSSPGNNYTLHSSSGLKLVFKSSPLHHTGSPAHVTESYSVKSEDSGISSQQNSVETVEDGAPSRKKFRGSSEEKEHYRTSGSSKVEVSSRTGTAAVGASNSENLPFTSYKEEKGDSKSEMEEVALEDVDKLGACNDWMFDDSPKSSMKPVGLSEADSAVAGLLSNSDILMGEFGNYTGDLLGDMTLEEHFNQNLGGSVFDNDKFMESGEQKEKTVIKAPQYEYISEVSDYDTDTNVGDKEADTELEGALGGLLSDMEQDGKDYATEVSFNNQSDPYSTDLTSQSEGEDIGQSSVSSFNAGVARGGGNRGTNETQSAIDSLLALESPQDFNYNMI